MADLPCIISVGVILFTMANTLDLARRRISVYSVRIKLWAIVLATAIARSHASPVAN